MIASLLWQGFSTIMMFVVGIYASRLALLLFRRRSASAVFMHRSRLPAKTLVILGSGGHTMEMTRLLCALNPGNYQPRYYIMADTDKNSAHKVSDVEEVFSKSIGGSGPILFRDKTGLTQERHHIIRIPRSREVGQSYFTSIFTTIYSFAYSLYHVALISPDLVLCNGPGTSVPVCVAAFMLKLFMFSDLSIVYVESFCRVTSLSLSAKILSPIADFVLVQWRELADANPRCHYIGPLL